MLDNIRAVIQNFQNDPLFGNSEFWACILATLVAAFFIIGMAIGFNWLCYSFWVPFWGAVATAFRWCVTLPWRLIRRGWRKISGKATPTTKHLPGRTCTTTETYSSTFISTESGHTSHYTRTRKSCINIKL